MPDGSPIAGDYAAEESIFELNEMSESVEGEPVCRTWVLFLMRRPAYGSLLLLQCKGCTASSEEGHSVA